MISRFENFKLNESEILPPEIPNTMNFWHGGNLDYYDDIISQKNGRYEYGAGLYIVTDYSTAKKYAKGSRKLYLLTIENGVDINYAFLDVDKVKEFIDFYVIGSLKKMILNRIEKHIKNDKVPGYIFNNIILNEKAISSTKTKFLREFYVKNGIDYDIMYNPFGNGEMMVLYNMKKIVNKIVIKPKDNIKEFELKNIYNKNIL